LLDDNEAPRPRALYPLSLAGLQSEPTKVDIKLDLPWQMRSIRVDLNAWAVCTGMHSYWSMDLTALVTLLHYFQPLSSLSRPSFLLCLVDEVEITANQ